MNNETISTLVKVLLGAERAEIVGAESCDGGCLTLDVRLDGGERLTLLLGNLSVVRGDLEVLAARPRNLRGRYNRVKNADTYSVEELKARNYPLYWNRQWLANELEKFGTYSEVARQHGYPSATTIASYAKRRFGFDMQGDFDRKRLDVVARYEAGEAGDAEPISQSALAQQFGVAVATVCRWLQEHREGLTPDPGRLHKRIGRGRSREDV
jgi:hypothetical protein